jgi:hypothetical protein
VQVPFLRVGVNVAVDVDERGDVELVAAAVGIVSEFPSGYSPMADRCGAPHCRFQ